MSQDRKFFRTSYFPEMGKSRRPNSQHDQVYINLRLQLKQLRLDAGITQTELGDFFERPHTFVHKVESGDRRIDPVEFCRWCHACGVDPAVVITPVSQNILKKSSALK